jgi:putative PIN family toxin of toxin-antitoxin system
MGSQESVIPRVVFDSSTVVPTLLFARGHLAWLRPHWRHGGCVPLISRVTAAELARVLRYPKFGLSAEDCRELLADYLPHCEVIEPTKRCPCVCRDKNDQPFLDLAESSKADVLVSGDKDLLSLAGKRSFAIETAEAYCRRVSGG